MDRWMEALSLPDCADVSTWYMVSSLQTTALEVRSSTPSQKPNQHLLPNPFPSLHTYIHTCLCKTLASVARHSTVFIYPVEPCDHSPQYGSLLSMGRRMPSIVRLS
jgi:hypothetical protein